MAGNERGKKRKGTKEGGRQTKGKNERVEERERVGRGGGGGEGRQAM